MNLDLRIPMGLMFLLVGLILTIFGMVTNGSEIYLRSGGTNVNIGWGLVLLIFGAIMFTLGRRNQRRLAKEPQKPQEPGTVRRGH